MTHYRLRPIAWEEHGDAYWIAALPHGPTTLIDGAGLQVLTVFEEPGRTLTLDELITELRAVTIGMPDGIEKELSTYLITLTGLGILEVVQ